MNREAWLRRAHACEPGMEYALGHETNQQAWDACTRPEWMIWFYLEAAGARQENRRLLVKLLLAGLHALLPTCMDDPRPLLRVLSRLARCKKTPQRKELTDEAHALSRSALGLPSLVRAFTLVLSRDMRRVKSEVRCGLNIIYACRWQVLASSVDRQLADKIRKLIPVCPPMNKRV